MATWNIQYEPHGNYVTCQRPIIISTKVTDGAVAHFTGNLYVRDAVISTQWNDTGMQLNAYGNTDGEYNFNLAEYCRQFFLEEGIYSAAWCRDMENMVQREFYLKIYPVEYSESGNLIPNPSDTKDSNSFFSVPLNTKVNEATSASNDYIRIDKFVLNGGNGSSSPLVPESMQHQLSNMPDYNVVDVDAGYHSYYNYLYESVSGRSAKCEFTNDSGTTYTLALAPADGYNQIIIHPKCIDWLLSNDAGSAVYGFTDAAGDLTSKTVKIQLKFTNSTSGAVERTVPPAYYKFESKLGCKGSETFLFRNMRGGFDFFTATGTKESSVSLSGSTFDRHTDFNRQETGFGIKKGQHNITNLWNSRKETFSIFSQPLTKEFALWVEELIVSPQVWIVKKTEDFLDGSAGGCLFNIGYSDIQLVAINIDKGSYKLHTTEKNVSFVEFKYSLSENTLIQKT